MALVLIVDDDPEFRTAVVKKLTSGTGLRGLELASSGQPDLILLDIHLPELDGFSFLKKMWGRREPYGQHGSRGCSNF